jgi:hypothetical protein
MRATIHDLARPIALHFWRPKLENRAYEIVKDKLFDWKCFP